ncbi:MAG: protein kinase [Clostridia bacterium]|nr:protein kinase [Clostridia bacterium]
MEQYINGYRLLSPFTTAGAGSARWTFAEKDGQEYFLKEFLAPVYPVDSIPMPDSVRASRRAACLAYERSKSALYRAIRAADNGNIVAIHEFFRHEAKYYISTPRINEAAMSAAQLAALPIEKQKVLIRVLVNNMLRLENAGIVHADLKPTNIMIKPTLNGFFSLKLIDFDGSFFVSEPPEDCEDLQGDPVYLAPEMFLAMSGSQMPLTSKIDVFATGLIIHEILTGELPTFSSEYDYAFEAALEGGEIRLGERVPDDFREIISDMLKVNPAMRPSFSEVFTRLAGPGAAAPAPKAPETYKKRAFMRPAGDL